MTMRPDHSSSLAASAFSVVVLWLLTRCGSVRAQEKLYFDTPPFTPNVTHRQNICDKYNLYRNGVVELRDALEGFQLRPILTSFGSYDPYFPYNDDDEGIDPINPGILVELLDELAKRAKFTWRESFAVMAMPPPDNATNSDIVSWAVQTYDISVNWWSRTSDRLERGIAFLEPWVDGSYILVEKQTTASTSGNGIGGHNLSNFMRPFETSVWLLILFTVVLSSLIYQLIEYIQGESPKDGSWWEWTSYNLYLSAINFSQNFEYAPTSVGGRIFGVSMTLFALLITATYTANLASLLVDSHSQPPMIESIEQAILLGKTICTFDGSSLDGYIQTEFPKAKRIPKTTDLNLFEALQRGECDLIVTYKDAWFNQKGDSRYNPQCDIEWVGRIVKSNSAGFAVRADSGFKCTAFISNVLNVHMVELINEGFLERFKAKHRRRFQEAHPTTCDNNNNNNNHNTDETDGDDESDEEEKVGSTRRNLKAAGAAAPQETTTPQSKTASLSLSLESMSGTFLLHWVLMGIAVLVTAANAKFMANKGRGNPEYDNCDINTKESCAVSEERPGESSPIQQQYTEEEEPQIRNEQSAGAKLESQAQHNPLASHESFCTTCGTCLSNNNRFDWEAVYATMSAQDKAIVDLLFRRKGNPLLVPTDDAGIVDRKQPIDHEGSTFTQEDTRNL